jgi:hypothetical protein
LKLKFADLCSLIVFVSRDLQPIFSSSSLSGSLFLTITYSIVVTCASPLPLATSSPTSTSSSSLSFLHLFFFVHRSLQSVKMVDQFVGSWQMTKSDKFDEFMAELGITWVVRRLAQSSKPLVTISQDGDYIVIKTASAVKTTEIKFKLGEEFEEARADGVKVKSVINLQDNKLVQVRLSVIRFSRSWLTSPLCAHLIHDHTNRPLPAASRTKLFVKSRMES